MNLLLEVTRKVYGLDGIAKERKATVRTLGYVFGVGFAPLVIIEVQYEVDAGYLTHL